MRQSRPHKLLQGLPPNITPLIRVHSRYIPFLKPINRNYQLLTKSLILNPLYRIRISMKGEDQSPRARKAIQSLSLTAQHRLQISVIAPQTPTLPTTSLKYLDQIQLIQLHSLRPLFFGIIPRGPMDFSKRSKQLRAGRDTPINTLHILPDLNPRKEPVHATL